MNSTSLRALGIATLTATALGTLPAMAAAAPGPGPEPRVTAGTQAQYKVTATSFKTIDESGVDWTGSDEPYFILSSEGLKGTKASRKTRTFGDVDSGDTRYFSGTERCVFPMTCGTAAAPNGIGLSVQMWEEDGGEASAVLAKTGEYFKKAKVLTENTPVSWVGSAAGYVGQACNIVSGWLKDDLLGSRTFTLTKAELDANLTYSGDSYQVTRYLGDSGRSGTNTPGYHVLRLTVSRTDVRVPMVLSNPGTLAR